MAQSATMNARAEANAGAMSDDRCGVVGTILADETSAPEWVELIPAGEFEGRDGRGPYRLDDPARVIAATAALKMDAGLPIDYDHATDFAAPEGRPAPAAGWIREFAARDGALWGRVEWTRPGAEAIATHEYRYISPVFEYANDGSVVRLLRAALTNNPNLYLTALAARIARERDRNAAAIAGSRGRDEAAPRAQPELDEAASAEAIGAEVQRRSAGKARDADDASAARWDTARADAARYVPMAEFERTLAELNRVRAAHARERAEYRVANAMKAGKIVPAQREWAIAYCEADVTAFDSFVARQPAVAAGMGRFGYGEAGEAGAAADGQPRTRVVLSRIEAAVCARLGIKREEYAARRGARGDGVGEDPRD